MGRRSTFSPEIGKAICAQLATGKPLTQICQGDGMPCDDTVRNWAQADEQFARAIARARNAGFDAIAADALRIADTPCEGVEIEENEDGEIVKTKRGDMLGHRRLQVDTRLKLLAKWDPKRYGDLIKHSGPDGSSPAVAALTVAFVAPGQQQSPDEG